MRASSSLVLAGTFFAPFLDCKTPAKSFKNYELFVYWQNLFAVYCTVTLLSVTLLESDHDIVGCQVSDLILQDIETVELASDWLIANFGTIITVTEIATFSHSCVITPTGHDLKLSTQYAQQSKNSENS